MSAPLPDPGLRAGMRSVDGPIGVLHVDDDRAFSELCVEFLELGSDRLVVDTATSAAEGLEYIDDDRPDCIVSDYDMPGMDGLEFLEAVREQYPRLPFILFTGKGSEEIASEAISAGVTDYLQKSRGREQYRILRNRIRNSVPNYYSQRRVRMFRSAVEHSGHSIYITDTDGVIEYVNPSFTETTGYTAEEAVGRTPDILKSGEHDAEFYAELWETILGGEVWESEIINRRKDGELYVADQTIAPIFPKGGEPEKFVAVNQEMTDRRTHRLSLRRRCESLGALNRTLRYRIRDDLQAVIGYAGLLEEHVRDSGTEYLRTLEEHSWNVFDRIEAAQSFADLMYQTGPEGSMGLRQAVQSGAKSAETTTEAESVTVSVDEDVSPIPIVNGRMLESVVRILTESTVRYGSDTSEVQVLVAGREDALSIRVRIEDGDGSDGAPEPPDEMGDLDIAGRNGSKLHVLRDLTDGYGGEIRIENRNGFGFAVEFPADRFLPEGVRSR